MCRANINKANAGLILDTAMTSKPMYAYVMIIVCIYRAFKHTHSCLIENYFSYAYAYKVHQTCKCSGSTLMVGPFFIYCDCCMLVMRLLFRNVLAASVPESI